MTQVEAKKLGHGLFRIYWKDGGASLAAVGSLSNGSRWFAATNWTGENTSTIASTKWAAVERAVLIAARQ